VNGAALATATFLAMEGVTYAVHRWVMHGPGMVWHRSHHERRTGTFERNDLFPLCFASVGVVLFALHVWPVAIGVTAYGAAYLAVHEVFVHRRVRWNLPRNAYLDWLRESHRLHHAFGGEPYGMLLPVLRASARTARARL